MFAVAPSLTAQKQQSKIPAFRMVFREHIDREAINGDAIANSHKADTPIGMIKSSLSLKRGLSEQQDQRWLCPHTVRSRLPSINAAECALVQRVSTVCRALMNQTA